MLDTQVPSFRLTMGRSSGHERQKEGRSEQVTQGEVQEPEFTHWELLTKVDGGHWETQEPDEK